VLGRAIPFHTDFDEVNLRFYVRFERDGVLRRGVAFIREIVPRRAIAVIARRVYNEPYVSLTMRHTIEVAPPRLSVDYGWRVNGHWNRLSASAAGAPSLPAEGGFEQFIAEHHWGYTAQLDGGTIEYEVAHPPWLVWAAQSAAFDGDAKVLYGTNFSTLLQRAPDSAFIAEGSPVTVSAGTRVEAR
jgi:uncharacterized protein YqjF (DUF2071 family)